MIGRSQIGNDLVLEDDEISRSHAHLIRSRDGTWTLEDHSANGTFVDGQRVSRAILHPGCLLAFGSNKEMTFQFTTLTQANMLTVGREIEGGNREMSEIDLPCVLSIQTGINEPRYVGMRGIRQVASPEIPTYGASDLGVDASSVGEAAAKVKREDYFVPALGKGAEILQGDNEAMIAKLIELMKAKGGLQ